MTTIDLNSDVGESFGRWRLGDDEAVLGLVTSANVACGFHAGDPRTLRVTCALAAERGVVVGAQVGYRDLAGFGRRFIDVDPLELTDDVIYQIGALDAMARAAGHPVRYVKPHGALYNTAVHHERQARAVVDAVLAYDAGLPLLGLPGSRLLALGERPGCGPSARRSPTAATPRGDAGPAQRGGRAAPRRRRGRPPGGPDGHRGVRGGRRRLLRGPRRRVGVPARRLARCGRDGRRGAGRAGEAGVTVRAFA